MENDFLWREPEKSLSSPERIGFHSVATVWFSFHWLFWLLRSAGCMFSSATEIFLSLLHAKVGRERLVYFIVSNHSVLNLYFIKWLGLNMRRTKFDLLVTFFTLKDVIKTAYFGDFFVLYGTAFAISFLMSLSLDSITRVWFPFMLNKRKEKLKLCASKRFDGL